MKLFFNAYKLARQVTAWFLRNTVMLEWYQVLTKPINQVNHDLPNGNKKYDDDLEDFKKESNYLYHKDYSTIAYEGYLNDKFDNSQRRINISHDDNYNELAQLFLISENQPLPATYLLSEVSNNASLSQSDLLDTYMVNEQFPDDDFIVEIPQGVYTQSQQDNIRLQVENDKLLGKSFEIIEV